jgi:hypothetical protein
MSRNGKEEHGRTGGVVASDKGKENLKRKRDSDKMWRGRGMWENKSRSRKGHFLSVLPR